MTDGSNFSERETRDRTLFDEISERYVRKDMLVPHRRARMLRLNQTLGQIGCIDDLKILELGCGAGFSAAYIGDRPAKYVGIDYSEGLIKVARSMNSNDRTEFEVAHIHEYTPNEKFDVVFMIGLLHHLDDPIDTLGHVKKFIKTDGVIVANEPQSGNPLVSWMRRVRKKMDNDYSDEQLEYSKSDLVELFSNAELKEIKVSAQGLFSTPFAEVVFPLQWLANPLSSVSCATDSILERRFNNVLQRLSWNLIVSGKVGGISNT